MAQNLNVADLKIKSLAFEGHKRIPDRHTSNGENVAPPLEWSGAPEDTQAFAIVVHDPDAPLVDGFTHWVAYGIPANASGLAEGGEGPTQGLNSMGEEGYTGPAPPPGHGPTTTTSGSTRSMRTWSCRPASIVAPRSNRSKIT